MSSILRALKKIEKTAPRPEESQPWPRPIDTKKAVNSRVKTSWLFNKLISIVIIIMIIVAMAWLAFSQKDLFKAKLFPDNSQGISQQQGTSSKSKAKVYQAKIEKKGLKSEPGAQRPSALQDKPSAKPSFRKKSLKFSSHRSVSDQLPTGKTHVPQAGMDPSPAETSNPLQNTKLPQQLNQQSRLNVSPQVSAKKSRPTMAPSRKTNRSPSKDPYAGLPRFSDSKLKLQAIAWAHEASQRLAVINNRIVREGDSVDGYTIVQIRFEDVIVNDGTGSWRLEFSLAK
ncbi:MAG: general secretion pathway protein GspB [Desulfobacterales bacterium]